MPDFPDIGYGTVHGRFLAGVLDDLDPVVNPTPPGYVPELAPDAEPLSGFVTFSATAPIIAVVGATPPTTLFPQHVKVYLDDEGYLSINGSRDVTLWATDDPDGNPVDWQWHVAFSLDHRGHGIYKAPFNFELPADTIVDLTTVAPVATPSPGTIIIQGPQGEPGPPGPSALDLINAKGDLVAGTADNAADVVPVGLPGEYLTPDPAVPTGLDWKPLPVPDAGLKVYADLAEVEAVRTAEIGTLHLDNLAAAFPNLAAAGSPGTTAFSGVGPADLVITSSVSDFYSPGANSEFRVLYQTFTVGDVANSTRGVRVARQFLFGPGLNEAGHAWEYVPDLPLPGGWQDRVPLSKSEGDYRLLDASVIHNPDTIMRRDVFGQSQIADPTSPAHVANKQYVDGAIAAIPPAGGGLKVYTTLAEVEAVREPEVGTLHVTNLAATFPDLAAVGSGVESVFASTGPADLLISTSQNYDTNAVMILGQVFEVFNLTGAKFLIKRTYCVDVPMYSTPWHPHPEMPTTNVIDDIPIFRSGGWTTTPSSAFVKTPVGYARGDLIVRGSSLPSRLPQASASGMVLTADLIQSLRMVWAMPKPAPWTNMMEWGGTNIVVDVNNVGNWYNLNAAGPIVITVPSTGVPAGSQIVYMQNADGPVTFVAGAGAILKAPGGKTKLAGQYSKAILTKMNYEQWLVEGDLVVP